MAKPSPKLSAQILDEASVWFTEFSAGGLDTVAQAQFNTWLRRSPEHVQAYLQISAFWEDADMLNTHSSLDLDDLIARARQESNVYPLERAADDVAPASRAGRLRSLLALAASMIVVLAATTWLYAQRGVYTTDIGEQRSIALDDGSSVELNAVSRLRVRFTDDQRMVELLNGQALFRVAKDPGRPFVVSSGDARVRAVGTQFDVYRKRGEAIVTVVEGRVAVAAPTEKSSVAGRVASTAASSNHHEVLLGAGEQLRVGTGAPTRAATQSKPHRANVAVATAWIQKKLVFEGAPLGEVVEEFNRYNRRQLVIRDPSLYEFHVSGVFSSTDSNRMLDVLRRRFRVSVSESGGDIEISRPADDSPVGESAQKF